MSTCRVQEGRKKSQKLTQLGIKLWPRDRQTERQTERQLKRSRLYRHGENGKGKARWGKPTRENEAKFESEQSRVRGCDYILMTFPSLFKFANLPPPPLYHSAQNASKFMQLMLRKCLEMQFSIWHALWHSPRQKRQRLEPNGRTKKRNEKPKLAFWFFHFFFPLAT